MLDRKLLLPEICPLTQHPEVGGDHEGGGEAVEGSAPDRVLRPDPGLEQDWTDTGADSQEIYLPRLYQRIQAMLLRARERKRFVWMVTR